jgi:hypothetical protein
VVAEVEIMVGVDAVAVALAAEYLAAHRPIVGAHRLRALHLTQGVPDPHLLPSDVRVHRGVLGLAVLCTAEALLVDPGRAHLPFVADAP